MAGRRGPTHIRNRHRAVIARGEPPCHICGLPIDYTLPASDPMAYVVDHVIPLARGGLDALQNMNAAHRRRLCNARKGRKEYAPIIKRSGALTLPK